MFLQNTTFWLLNYPVELLPRKGFNEQILIRIEVCALGADFHSELEAVAGLTGYMAGLRFLCVQKFVQEVEYKIELY